MEDWQSWQGIGALPLNAFQGCRCERFSPLDSPVGGSNRTSNEYNLLETSRDTLDSLTTIEHIALPKKGWKSGRSALSVVVVYYSWVLPTTTPHSQ